MKKSSTPSFCLTLKLNTPPAMERELNERFFDGFMMNNKLVKHARKCLSGLRQDKRYRELLKLRREKPSAETNRQLQSIVREHGLSEYQFHKWIAVQQKRYRKHIDSFTAQKIASSVWRGTESVLYRKGESVHFSRFKDFLSLEGKSNSTGIRYRKGRVEWLGLSIYPQIRSGDKYARSALTHRVKYCRILRKPMGTSWHYYVQIVLEGFPPKKHEFLPNGRVGIDPGTSTEAVVSETGCLLTELAPERKHIEEEIAALQQRMDRSRRSMNPENYNEDGTVRLRGRKPWKCSRRYKDDRMRLKTLRRRNADAAKQSEEKLADLILCEFGSDIVSEKMDYSALAKKAKGSRINEATGRYGSRKRFGQSIGYHAPARFLGILNRKLSYIGKSVYLVDTVKFRASQYDHVSDAYIKVALGERWKQIGEYTVQRDLYSAFLLMNAKNSCEPDREKCIFNFRDFIVHHNDCIEKLISSAQHCPSSFGIA